MASALYTDVKRKEGHSIFIRPHEGLFGLREWADKGLVFKVPCPALQTLSELYSLPTLYQGCQFDCCSVLRETLSTSLGQCSAIQILWRLPVSNKHHSLFPQLVQ